MDGISDLIIRIKNASAVSKETVSMPYSKMKESILDVLAKEGFVKDVVKKGKKVHKSIEAGLIYNEYGPKVKGAERISHLSKRVYSGSKSLRPVKQGHGIRIITTPNGVMTDAEARKQNVGGEPLFKIW